MDNIQAIIYSIENAFQVEHETTSLSVTIRELMILRNYIKNLEADLGAEKRKLASVVEKMNMVIEVNNEMRKAQTKNQIRSLGEFEKFA